MQKYTYNFQYICLPAYVKFFPAWKVSPYLGYYFSVLLNSMEIDGDPKYTPFKVGRNPIDDGLLGGITLNLSKWMAIDARYMLGLVDLNRMIPGQIMKTYNAVYIHFSYNRGFSLELVFFFQSK